MRTLGFPQGHPRSAVARKGRGQQADRVRASPRYSCTGVRCAGGAPASAMRTTRRQSRVAGSYALSAIWGAPPPSTAAICKNTSFRGVLRYIVRAVLGPVLEYKNHTSLYSGTKTAANQGFRMAKSIAADAKMTRLIVRSPGGSAVAILQAAFDMRRYPSSPRTGPSP